MERWVFELSIPELMAFIESGKDQSDCLVLHYEKTDHDPKPRIVIAKTGESRAIDLKKVMMYLKPLNSLEKDSDKADVPEPN